jgi:hypothetical protein
VSKSLPLSSNSGRQNAEGIKLRLFRPMHAPLGSGPIYCVALRLFLPNNGHACMRFDLPSVLPVRDHRAFCTYRYPLLGLARYPGPCFSLRNVSPGACPSAWGCSSAFDVPTPWLCTLPTMACRAERDHHYRQMPLALDGADRSANNPDFTGEPARAESSAGNAGLEARRGGALLRAVQRKTASLQQPAARGYARIDLCPTGPDDLAKTAPKRRRSYKQRHSRVLTCFRRPLGNKGRRRAWDGARVHPGESTMPLRPIATISQSCTDTIVP